MKNTATFTTTTLTTMTLESLVEVTFEFDKPLPLFDWPRYMWDFLNTMGLTVQSENSAKCAPSKVEKDPLGRPLARQARLVVWLLDCTLPEQGEFSIQDSPTLGRFTSCDLMRFFKYATALKNNALTEKSMPMQDELAARGYESLLHLYSDVRHNHLAEHERYGGLVDELLVDRSLALWESKTPKPSRPKLSLVS